MGEEIENKKNTARNLRGLAAAGVAGDDHQLIERHGVQDVLAVREDRQRATRAIHVAQLRELREYSQLEYYTHIQLM